ARTTSSQNQRHQIKTGMEKKMARPETFRSALFLAGAILLGSSILWAAEDIISKTADASGNCHLKFPAIREDTLFTNRPVLKDASAGDIIDFYGPCDYDPLGRDSVRRQRYEHQIRMRKEYGRD
ncbi:MAG TPA: hypothetical protein VFU31_19730, partial [Candidatus Binatia bacterium]|nr:hypothetical protein [Candidatus Binatia bacterium]